MHGTKEGVIIKPRFGRLAAGAAEISRIGLYIWASQGFDRGLAAGEAIRRLMRQIAK